MRKENIIVVVNEEIYEIHREMMFDNDSITLYTRCVAELTIAKQSHPEYNYISN
jgi:hypothetical protein